MVWLSSVVVRTHRFHPFSNPFLLFPHQNHKLTPPLIGAVGVEMAAELKHTHPALPITLIHSREKLLSSEPLPDEVKDTALTLLKETGVTVLMGRRLERTEEVVDEEGGKCVRVWLSDGGSLLADKVNVAVSRSRPSTGFLPRGVVDGEGFVKVKAE